MPPPPRRTPPGLGVRLRVREESSVVDVPPTLSSSSELPVAVAESLQLSRAMMYLMIRFMASSTFSPVLAEVLYHLGTNPLTWAVLAISRSSGRSGSLLRSALLATRSAGTDLLPGREHLSSRSR